MTVIRLVITLKPLNWQIQANCSDSWFLLFAQKESSKYSMPCNHDAARNLLGIGWVHTVFLLIPGRSTHGHRQAQVRKEWEKHVGEGRGGKREGGKKQGRKTMQLGMSSPCIASQGEAISQARGRIWECAAQRSKMGLGDKSLVDISSGNISCDTRRFDSPAKTHFERHQIRVWVPVYGCTGIWRHRWWRVHRWRDTSTEYKEKKKKKWVAIRSHWRRDENGLSRTSPSADSLTDGTLNANHNRDQLTRPPHQHRCCQHWTWHGGRCIKLRKGERAREGPSPTAGQTEAKVRRLTM